MIDWAKWMKLFKFGWMIKWRTWIQGLQHRWRSRINVSNAFTSICCAFSRYSGSSLSSRQMSASTCANLVQNLAHETESWPSLQQCTQSCDRESGPTWNSKCQVRESVSRMNRVAKIFRLCSRWVTPLCNKHRLIRLMRSLTNNYNKIRGRFSSLSNLKIEKSLAPRSWI